MSTGSNKSSILAKLTNDITTKVVLLEARQPLLHAVQCWVHDLDDGANLLCGKSLEEMLCIAWLIRHPDIFTDLLSGEIKRFKKICDGKTCHAQPCSLTQKATLDPLIQWAKQQKLLDAKDIPEAEYIRDKRNDHGHAYAMRLYGKSGGTPSIFGIDPDTKRTIKRTADLVARVKVRLDALVPTWKLTP